MPSEKPRILFCSDSLNQASGLAYVTINFLKRFLLSGYPVAYVSMKGDAIKRENLVLLGDDIIELLQNVPIYHARPIDKEGAESFSKVIIDFKPDIVFSNLDPWDLDIIAHSAHRESYYWILYSTLETPRYP